jgi:predicted ATPase/class 3 adenylate cyclase/tetratricopeptide (TPR) repeat protein
MPLPSGTITFLFTDIEGSTKLWEQHPDAMRAALARHDALLRQAIEDNSGVVFKTVGDAFCAAFATAPDALSAALAAQCALHAEPWPDALSLHVRMALHTGTAELRDNDYFGQPLNRVARLLGTGHGGQVLVSAATQELTRDTLPTSSHLQDVGEHRLRDLGRPESVFQLLNPDLPSEFPPLKSLDNPDLPNNLPQQVTSFIGRENEIETVKSLLTKTRLLTLTGSGGCGKTRLGLQVAADVLENYPDGVWLVELAPLSDPALLPQTVAQALNVHEEPGKPLLQTLATALKARRLLLVLDNCEHLLDACAHLADMLIRACPNLKILASSREGLGIAGETIYRIPSLSLPDLKQTATPASLRMYEAVRLFVDRAMAALPTFTVTNQNAPALASVCHRLDGIPLAIELAAARVRSLAVEEINNKLDNRFRLLTGGSRTALPRQQTLRALIDWSFDLLTPQEKTLLCRLSVFVGGWTLEAAEQVGSGEGGGEDIEDWEVLDLLTSLADKSLVVVETSEGSTRYHLLETVRQYARDHLSESGEAETVRSRHFDFCDRLMGQRWPQGRPDVVEWLRRVDTEHDNLRAALDWGLPLAPTDEGVAVRIINMASFLGYYCYIRALYREGCDYLKAALAANPAARQSEEKCDVAFEMAATLYEMVGKHEEAHLLMDERLILCRERGDDRGVANVCLNFMGLRMTMGDKAGALALAEEALRVIEATRERAQAEGRETEKWVGPIQGVVLTNLAMLNAEDDPVRAWVLYREALALLREPGNKDWLAVTLINIGTFLLRPWVGRDVGAAVAHLREGLVLTGELRKVTTVLEGLRGLAQVALERGEWERGTCLLGAAEGLRQKHDLKHGPESRSLDEQHRAIAQSTIGEHAFAAAWEEGRAMTMEQAVEYAMEEGRAA